MICVEMPFKSLDDEIARLQTMLSPNGTERQFAHGAIVALQWVRDGKVLPSEYLLPHDA